MSFPLPWYGCSKLSGFGELKGILPLLPFNRETPSFLKEILSLVFPTSARDVFGGPKQLHHFCPSFQLHLCLPRSLKFPQRPDLIVTLQIPLIFTRRLFVNTLQLLL